MTTVELSSHEAREAVISPSVRRAVLERDSYQCQYCGRSDRLELHHWLDFRSHQGANVPENLVTLCHEHHQDVHGARIDVYLLEVSPGVWSAFVLGRM